MRHFDGVWTHWRKALVNPQRLPGLDYLRGLAILSVVLYHYHYLPYGFLGVDLFFVISGFLVGGPLLEKLMKRSPIDVGHFYLSRATKILPSYFAFLTFAGFVSYFLYRRLEPDAVLHLINVPKYVLFLANYRAQDSFIFAHVWSLCVEEHFYVILPIAALSLSKFKTPSKHRLAVLILAAIVLITLVRINLALHGHETLVTTHSRIDAMMWGLCAWLVTRDRLFSKAMQALFLLAAIALAATLIYLDVALASPLFTNGLFHGGISFACFLALIACLNARLRWLGWLRVISYFSYNFYLWHMLFYFVVLSFFGRTPVGCVVFIVTGFGLAVLATVLFEEPGLKIRGYFKSK